MIKALQEKWAFKILTHQLTYLETLTLELNELADKVVDGHASYESPSFKPSDCYLTHEGFNTGTVCWYVRCWFNGAREMVCARTPERAMELAIEGFNLFLDGSDMREWECKMRNEAAAESQRQSEYRGKAYNQ